MNEPKPRRIVFVCTGNTCRSPMAESMLIPLARNGGLPWTISSAGTQALPGTPLSPGAAAVLTERSVAARPHRSRSLDAALAREADLIYALEREHRREIVARFPEAAPKTFVLREAAGLLPVDVKDPVGSGSDAYRACAASIEEALKIIVRRESNAPNTR